MLGLLRRYTHWLHTQWPAGTVEKFPAVNDDGTTNVPGLYVVGDLTGVPLLKFAADSGAAAVQSIVKDASFGRGGDESGDVLDVAIIGGSVSGIAAAIEAKKAGLSFAVFEASGAFSTIANFPKAKPIYTYPTEFVPRGDLTVSAPVKESLFEELEAQRVAHGIELTHARISCVSRKDGLLHLDDAISGATRVARRVIVAIGRSGNFRKLGVEGEDLDKVFNRLHDPKEYAGRNVLVVGGGDSAAETATALASSGAHVTLSYRKSQMTRPKPENVESVEQIASRSQGELAATDGAKDSPAAGGSADGESGGSLTLRLATQVKSISADAAVLAGKDGREEALPNDYVFSMIGREPPLDFFRRSGVTVRGDRGMRFWGTLSAFLVFCVFMYYWKTGGNWINELFVSRNWFPFFMASGDNKSLIGSILNASRDPGFYYSVAYCLCVIIFGVRRIRRRKTPYVTRQTITLALIQVIPLFLLPYIVLPWMGANGWFSGGGIGQWFGDTFFPNGSYWRSFGFILAWPLFIWNVFDSQPVWGWLVLSLIQTFVIIPLLIYRYGKGAYCGWICSCGALAETLGDAHRDKMPHGPFWNRLNMLGQVVLAFAFIILAVRIVGWVAPNPTTEALFKGLLTGFPIINYKNSVDIWLAGVLGVGLYFHFSGRMWCRFACPLAALMHIYARFSKFRIFADKNKCISCNVCTSVCHQGIDVMNFANKGLAMEDPECVRCSACVQSCPTGVLTFGRIGPNGEEVHDKLSASPVRVLEAYAGKR